MDIKTYIIVALLISTFQLSAQENILSKEVKFRDGLYLSHNDFATNSPYLDSDEFSYKKLNGLMPMQLYLHNIKVSPDIGVNVDTAEIWGICVNGVPYLNQSMFRKLTPSHIKTYYDMSTAMNTQIFTKIMFIGHLCHFTTYWESSKDETDFLLGDTDEFRRKGPQQHLLKVSTGEIKKFSPKSLCLFIIDDKELFLKYDELPQRKQEKEIFNFFREYNKRNPVRL